MENESDVSRPLRVLLAVGNPERERGLRDGLSAANVLIAARCLDGPSLLEHAGGLDIDVALVSSDLHRLTATTMTAMREGRLPVVLLAEPEDVERYRELAHLVPAGAAVDDVVVGLREAVARGPVYASSAADGLRDGDPAGSADEARDDDARRGHLIAVASGKGAPGKTTIAIGLAAALADRGQRVVLVDADLRGGNVGAYLDIDPRRGLLGLAFGGNGASEAHSVEDELQDGPGFAVLNGLERPELEVRVSAEQMTATVAALRSRFEAVVVDAGEVTGGRSSPATDALLRNAGWALLVSGADLVALWNARAAMQRLREGLGLPSEKVAIVLNRREGREHYRTQEVERALHAPVLASLPEDRRSARRSIERQAPITSAGGRVARGLRRLAGRLDGVPPAAAPTTQKQPLLPGRRVPVERT